MLDPLVSFCAGGNMNDNAKMSSVMRQLKRLRRAMGALFWSFITPERAATSAT